jgi:prefoldin subunit 5
MFEGSPMSVSSAESILRNAKQQLSQRDINDSLMKAIAELTKEVKRLDDEVRRARREAQMGRRFS